MATLLSLLYVLVVGICYTPQINSAIQPGTSNTQDNRLLTGEKDSTTATTTAGTAAASPTTYNVNTDIGDKLSWQCINNATCLYSLANGVVNAYRRGDTLKIGSMELVKLPAKSHTKWHQTGRGDISTLMDFINGNSIRIPVGPMVFSLQRSDTDGNYIELALLKKATESQGRLGGGDDGDGHNIISNIRKRHQAKQDKKQFQMMIPMYLAATTFGWTLVVAKAVALLTLKALAVSKLAFIVAAMVIIKKMMDNASEKMMYSYPEQTPYMMPYGMDYAMHPMGGDIGGAAEMYPAALQLAAAGGLAQPTHPGFDGLNAESSYQHNVAEVQNNTHVLAALNAASLAQKVKRDDSWLVKLWKYPLRSSAGMASASTSSSWSQKRRPHRPFNLEERLIVSAAAEAAVVDDEHEENSANDFDFFALR